MTKLTSENILDAKQFATIINRSIYVGGKLIKRQFSLEFIFTSTLVENFILSRKAFKN